MSSTADWHHGVGRTEAQQALGRRSEIRSKDGRI